MRVCLIAVEIFAWGKYGGFGRATRTIGRELVKRGIDVSAVVPRRGGQRPVEILDGITVRGFSPRSPWQATRLLRECDADVYHSCEPSFASYLAMRAMPHRVHVATVRDPRELRDWMMEFDRPSRSKLQVTRNYLYESNPLVRRAVRRMDAVFAPARSLVSKARALYGLTTDPVFLPTPVAIPPSVTKTDRPTVCYLARLDRRKRPTLFLDLARDFPDVTFIAMGGSRDARWEQSLHDRYADVPNLEMTGFVDQFNTGLHASILERSWIMVNTASREGLPNAFLEAAAHRCAILSHVDPDGFASEFGYHARTDDFQWGLRYLLESGQWRERGQRGYEHVRSTFEVEHAMDQHVAWYETLLSDRRPRRPRAGREERGERRKQKGGTARGG
ncbi:MAG TPA: glycosyltransferase family 4 protein [Gemmatimonadaceae bacterium]|nr:glycosyltransferase family 4 protein [Gemmatimonadaceae bacterium]